MLRLAWLTTAQHVFQPTLAGRLELVSRKIVSRGPRTKTIAAHMGQMTMTVHNYRPRQFHRTSNGENLSCGYRDMGFASLAAARPAARPNRANNYVNPVCCVATVCHQVCCMYWGHLGDFHRAIYHLK